MPPRKSVGDSKLASARTCATYGFASFMFHVVGDDPISKPRARFGRSSSSTGK